MINKAQPNILVIDDDSAIRWVLEKALKKLEVNTYLHDSARGAISMIKEHSIQVVVSDIRMPGDDGLSLLEKIQTTYPKLPVVIMTAHADLDTAVAAFKGGAFEYLPKPFDINDALAVIERALREAEKQQGSKDAIDLEVATDVASDSEAKQASEIKASHDPEIIGDSPAMQNLFRAIGRLSKSDVTVLINGESGTGKELVAKALHRHSQRAKQAFIALNMAAIPKELVEAELFGHEKGAFTGATSQRKGRFEQANGGTLFLDEIGDMPLETQTRLLRVLADGEFYRVGGHTSIKVDVRVIAATHQNLQQKVVEGSFREDLFHRLNVIRLQLPRLAERTQDIPQLAAYFLAQSADELAVNQKTLMPDALDCLMRLSWPGNVRQLENVCRWLTVMTTGNEVHASDLPDDIASNKSSDNAQLAWQEHLASVINNKLNVESDDLLTSVLQTMQDDFEKLLIEQALAFTGGHKQQAAQLLGWGRNTLTRKMKEHQL